MRPTFFLKKNFLVFASDTRNFLKNWNFFIFFFAELDIPEAFKSNIFLIWWKKSKNFFEIFWKITSVKCKNWGNFFSKKKLVSNDSKSPNSARNAKKIGGERRRQWSCRLFYEKKFLVFAFDTCNFSKNRNFFLLFFRRIKKMLILNASGMSNSAKISKIFFLIFWKITSVKCKN